MWNERSKSLVADGKLVVLGLIQEQHAERARLYAQWKGFDFPILQDAMTRNGLGAVPVPILIDEHGIVRSRRARPDQLTAFVETKYEPPDATTAAIDKQAMGIKALTKVAGEEGSVAAWTNLGDAHLMWNQDADAATEAIEAYQKASSLGPTGYVSASLEFRLGVAYRARYDRAKASGQAISSAHQDDFRRAVEHWTAALEANPNQYIWRRRIQQYGPRQSKPYPFYDWVAQAEQEIESRGEKPVELLVPLSGSEVASQQRFRATETKTTHPDPKNRLALDESDYATVRATVVPSRVTPGETVRIHLLFETGAGKWNNEGQAMQVWLDPPKSGSLSKSAFEIAGVAEANSTEPRRVEWEYQTGKSDKGSVTLSGFAVYTVCVDADNTCRFLRKNFTCEVKLKE